MHLSQRKALCVKITWAWKWTNRKKFWSIITCGARSWSCRGKTNNQLIWNSIIFSYDLSKSQYEYFFIPNTQKKSIGCLINGFQYLTIYQWYAIILKLFFFALNFNKLFNLLSQIRVKLFQNYFSNLLRSLLYLLVSLLHKFSSIFHVMMKIIDTTLLFIVH